MAIAITSIDVTREYSYTDVIHSNITIAISLAISNRINSLIILNCIYLIINGNVSIYLPDSSTINNITSTTHYIMFCVAKVVRSTTSVGTIFFQEAILFCATIFICSQ